MRNLLEEHALHNSTMIKARCHDIDHLNESKEEQEDRCTDYSPIPDDGMREHVLAKNWQCREMCGGGEPGKTFHDPEFVKGQVTAVCKSCNHDS